MIKQIFEVVAVRYRYIKTASGTVKSDDGYVVHRSYQTADSGPDAIKAVKAYHITPGTKFDTIRAELVRAA